MTPGLSIPALLRADCFDHAVESLQLVETHISWVILTGQFVYKIKKPVNLGFLDFSTLEKRHYYCNEELRLNRRLAPEIYLAVVPVYGPATQPSLCAGDEVIDYAVQMRQFPREAQLDQLLARGELQAFQIDALASTVARFHGEVAVAAADSEYGDPAHVYAPVAENFTQVRERLPSTTDTDQLAALQTWSETTYARLEGMFGARKRDGFVRECHGDMHLGNLAWVDDAPLVFDCIEFNPNLRWIDVISEVAFLVMDLQDRQQPHFAQRFLDRYLQASGDYAGLAVLRFYLVYRAMVRAKVEAIRAAQQGIDAPQRNAAQLNFAGYLQLASSTIQPVTPQLLLTHGMSASGKSSISEILLEQLPALRLRSDVERKRLFGLRPEQDASASVGEGIYSAEATRRTYAHLAELAALLLDAEHSVIVDATFARAEQRAPFFALAAARGIRCTILECHAASETLRQRIASRPREVSDADLAVLERQIASWQPLSDAEQQDTIRIDTGQPFDAPHCLAQIRDRAGKQTG